MATHVQELDKLIDRVSDLQIEATDDGFDEAAGTLENVLEELRGIDFSSGEDEEGPDATED